MDEIAPQLDLWTGSAGGFAFRIVEGLDPVTPVDITGWEFRAVMRTTAGTPVVSADLRTPGRITVTDGPEGYGQVLFAPEDTARLPPGRYVFDVFREDPAPRQVLIIRPIQLNQAVTR